LRGLGDFLFISLLLGIDVTMVWRGETQFGVDSKLASSTINSTIEQKEFYASKIKSIVGSHAES
jgi:hypothetical protein